MTTTIKVTEIADYIGSHLIVILYSGFLVYFFKF